MNATRTQAEPIILAKGQHFLCGWGRCIGPSDAKPCQRIVVAGDRVERHEWAKGCWFYVCDEHPHPEPGGTMTRTS